MKDAIKTAILRETSGISRDLLALGWLRYESLRRFSVRMFVDAQENAAAGGISFDDAVDLAVEKFFAKKSPDVEEVLCFYRADLLGHILLPENGIVINPESAVRAAFDQKLAFFTERPSAEEDPNKKQIIPYCVLCLENGRFLRYTRGGASGEKRLVSKKSIGFGGHINPIDQCGEYASFDTYLEAVKRELMEEVGVCPRYIPPPVFLINDETNPVGAVHVGLVHMIKVTSEDAKSAEDAIEGLEEVSLSDLLSGIDELETWSQFVVNELAAGF